MFRRRFLQVLIVLGLGCQGHGAETRAIGSDLAEVFRRAKDGAPLRCVVMGGSITAAAKEGWIGPALREWFPASEVRIVNAGMSATGSELGVFRLERDVMGHQPDLVLLEFCVNDGNCRDEETLRNLETIIVRLKQMVCPPAIVVLEVAAKGGVNLKRHRRVARHYGLLEVDLQRAVDDHLSARKSSWATLFTDEVHPTDEGHALYAGEIAAALAPFRSGSAVSPEAREPEGLPPPLSAMPLLLDATMVSLGAMECSSWRREASLPAWWDRYFLGYLMTETPGAKLGIALRGTTFGLLFPMDPAFGSFLTAVDQSQPRRIAQNTREGYGFEILARDLPAGEHRLDVVVPATPDGGMAPSVRLGYLLVAGQSAATRSVSSRGGFSADVLEKLRFAEIPAACWRWAGPFPVRDPAAIDAGSEIETVFPPESSPPGPANWQSVPFESSDWIDMRRIRGITQPSIIYAETVVEAEEGGEIILGFAADYFSKLWLNDLPILTLEAPHNHTRAPKFVAVTLRPGKNRFLVKLGSGTMGFGFSMSIGTVRLPKEP